MRGPRDLPQMGYGTVVAQASRPRHSAENTAEAAGLRGRRAVVLCLGGLLAILLACLAARAEHFKFLLNVTAPADKAEAYADTFTDKKPQGFKPRPICHAKAGNEVAVQFFVSSNFPHDPIKNVTVHYYQTPAIAGGEDKSPNLANALIEGHFVLDFKPDTGKVGLRQRLKIEKPGTYLVRVESQNSANDHEHFSAIDLVVE